MCGNSAGRNRFPRPRKQVGTLEVPSKNSFPGFCQQTAVGFNCAFVVMSESGLVSQVKSFLSQQSPVEQ